MGEKTVLITGASRGIGKACAFAFAKAGYDIFINCRNSLPELMEVKAEIASLGVFCGALPGDVGNPHDVRRMFETVQTTHAGVDILINNAGAAHMGLLSDMSDEQWDGVIKTNLSSVFYCCREAIPYMVHQKAGRIVNISSMWGTVGASCEAAYSAAKSGVHGLTRALAKELAPSNVQVNAVAFGVIDTSMNSLLSETERQHLMEEIPAGRFGTPAEAAAFVLELAEGPVYMTGQVIGMDGGYI